MLAFTRTLDGRAVLCAVNAGDALASVTLPWTGAASDFLSGAPLVPADGLLTVELPASSSESSTCRVTNTLPPSPAPGPRGVPHAPPGLSFACQCCSYRV